MLRYPDDYDESDFRLEHPCEECRETANEKEYLFGLVGELVDILYRKPDVALFRLHDVIDEIGAYAGQRDIPDHLPPVVRMNKLGQEFHGITSDQVKSVTR